MNTQVQLGPESAKASAAVIGTSLGLSNVSWSDIAAIVTVIYVCLQILLLMPKFYEHFKEWRSKKG